MQLTTDTLHTLAWFIIGLGISSLFLLVIGRHQRRVEWIQKYAEWMHTRSGMRMEQCIESAAASLENLNDDLSEDPVQAADDDMAEWTG